MLFFNKKKINVKCGVSAKVFENLCANAHNLEPSETCIQLCGKRLLNVVVAVYGSLHRKEMVGIKHYYQVGSNVANSGNTRTCAGLFRGAVQGLTGLVSLCD